MAALVLAGPATVAFVEALSMSNSILLMSGSCHFGDNPGAFENATYVGYSSPCPEAAWHVCPLIEIRPALGWSDDTQPADVASGGAIRTMHRVNCGVSVRTASRESCQPEWPENRPGAGIPIGHRR